MSRLLSACMLALAASMAFGASAAFAADAPTPVDLIEALGGQAIADPTRPGSPVIKVVLTGDRITDKQLRWLASFPELRELDLSNTKVTNAGMPALRGLAKLENLNLSCTLVTDEGLMHLRMLGNLRYLDLSKPRKGEFNETTRFTDKALLHIKAMPKLASLKIEWNMLSDEGMMGLVGMKGLRELKVGVQSLATSKGRDEVKRALATKE